MPETCGPEQTERIAADLATTLRPGDVVLVSGELGAGKTTWVRGALRALGVTQRVTSPTFTLARRYEDGRVPVSHLDLYRLAGSTAEDPAILDGELGPDRVTFVEWPEAHEPALAGARVVARVNIAHAGGDRRAVSVERDPSVVPASATTRATATPPTKAKVTPSATAPEPGR